MALTGRLQTEMEIKSPAEKVFNLIRNQTNQIPKISPDNILSAEVLQDDCESNATIRLWKFTIGGKVYTKKDKAENDDVNKLMTFNVLEGDPLKLYKSFKAIIQFIPKENCSLVNITIEYEKLNEDTPVPHMNLELVMNLVKDIDAYLIKS